MNATRCLEFITVSETAAGDEGWRPFYIVKRISWRWTVRVLVTELAAHIYAGIPGVNFTSHQHYINTRPVPSSLLLSF